MSYKGLYFFSVSLILVFGSACSQRLPRVQKVVVLPDDLARAEAAAREGDIQMSKGEAYAALLRFLDAVKFNPNSEAFENKLAIAYAKLSYFDKAREAALRSLALNPQYAYGYNTLGTLELIAGKTSRAIKDFQLAIRNRADIASFYVNLANGYLQKDAIDKAIEALRQAVAIDPEIFTRQGGGGGVGVQSAAAPFKESSQFYVLARIYAERGDDVQALDSLKRAFEGGYTDFDRLRRDKEFARLKETPEFKELVEKFEAGGAGP